MDENNHKHNMDGRKKFTGYLRFLFGLLLLVLVFLAGFERGRKFSDTENVPSPVPIDNAVIKNKNGNNEIDFSLYWKAWDILKQKYVDSESLDARKMLYGSISGMLYSTGDPYTLFLSPEENKKFDEEIAGNFEGIGAELGIKNGILTIVAPLEGAPAEKAGLRPGDKILKINGEASPEMTLDEAANKIRGKKGTEVVLTIFREGVEDSFDVTVKREVVVIKSVKFETKPNDIAYIKISRFGDDTVKDFSDAISKAVSMKPKGIILDLRNNPGGYLEGAVNIASKMIPKGKIVLIEEDSEKKQDKIYARGGDVASGIETIVLINEGSASASEILAGALKENRDNITLLGKKTFGKGSVQELVDLPQGTAVKVTVAHWLTPNGNQINEKGISPDLEVELTNDDYQNNKDPQLDKALEIMGGPK